jgi:hypothetical protein
MIDGESRRQHYGEPATSPRQRNRALKEQLIEVGMSIPLPRVHAGASSECRQRGRIVVPAPFAAEHFPRRVSNHRVEPSDARGLPVHVMKYFRELQRPVEEELTLRDRRRSLQKRSGDVGGQDRRSAQ